MRAARNVNGVSTTFTYDGDDALLGTSGGFNNSYGYNGNGEQTSRIINGTAYSVHYGTQGQVVSVQGGGNALHYAYDALGRRVHRNHNGALVVSEFDGDQGAVWRAGAAAARTYSYGNDLVRMNGEYAHFDGHGSTRLLTDAGQNATFGISYDGFGQIIGSAGAYHGLDYLFGATSGYVTHGDGGLMLMGARYYDPQVGRFTSRDTLLSEHPYVYCDADPVNFVDPDGHRPLPKWLLELMKLLGVLTGNPEEGPKPPPPPPARPPGQYGPPSPGGGAGSGSGTGGAKPPKINIDIPNKPPGTWLRFPGIIFLNPETGRPYTLPELQGAKVPRA